MNQISFIITSPYYDSGIKSLGSKCIYSIKKNTILEKQYRAITKFCENIDYEIIFVNNVDNAKTIKFLDSKQMNIQYVYINQKNINHAGCFLKGLQLAKYDTIFNIECGLILSHQAISDSIIKSSQEDINIGCINNKHKQNIDLEIGCVINKDVIKNLFFGLDNKYIGINCMNKRTKEFILNNFNIAQDKNKYMFEIINSCISQNLSCKKIELKSKDAHLIFNKKSLQQYTG